MFQYLPAPQVHFSTSFRDEVTLFNRLTIVMEGLVLNMAKCPHCGYKLKIWNIKAECPKCGVSIPNYDWVNRLEQDSIIAEAANAKIKQTIAYLKYSFIGTKLRIARLPVSVLPLATFFLPLFTVNFNLPFYESLKSFNFLSLFGLVNKIDFSVLSNYISSPVLGGATVRFLLTIVFVFLSFLCLVPIGLFFLIRNYKNLQSKALFITNLAAGIMMLASTALFMSFTHLQQASTVNAFSGKVGFGMYICIVSFFASSIINLAVAKSEVVIPEPKEKQEETKPV